MFGTCWPTPLRIHTEEGDLPLEASSDEEDEVEQDEEEPVDKRGELVGEMQAAFLACLPTGLETYDFNPGLLGGGNRGTRIGLDVAPMPTPIGISDEIYALIRDYQKWKQERNNLSAKWPDDLTIVLSHLKPDFDKEKNRNG